MSDSDDASTNGGGDKATRIPFSEHFKNIAVGIAAICIPIVGYVYTDKESVRQLQANTDANVRQIQAASDLATEQTKEAAAEKDRELSKSYVDLAVSILQKKANGEYDPVRDWAVRLLNKNTDVKLIQIAQNSLVGQSLNDAHGFGDLVYYEVGKDGRTTSDGQLEVIPHQPSMPTFLSIKKGTYLQAASSVHLRTSNRMIGSEIKQGQCVITTADADPSLLVPVKNARSGGYLTVQLAACPGLPVTGQHQR